MKNTALLVIDPQNDYFPNYKYPLWNTSEILQNILWLISKCRQSEIPIVLVQHIADSKVGIAPFFAENSLGAEIHPDIKKAAYDVPVVIKHFADSFYMTNLEIVLKKLNIENLMICGMMTQNCVTHTAISKDAQKYKVAIITDCCTTVTQMIHLIALNAVSTRVSLLDSQSALAKFE